MDALIFFLIAFGIICVFIFAYKAGKRREKKFIESACKLGFTSTPQISKDIYVAMEKFRLFEERSISYKSSVAQGEREGIIWSVFNIHIRHAFSRARRDKTTWHETIAHAQLRDHVFPAFLLRRADAANKFGNAVGKKNISFSGHPEFSRLYQLEGGDEQAIRELFAPHILTFFEQKNREYMQSAKDFGIISFGGKMLNIEAKGSEFVFSFNYMQIAPQELPDFLDDASEILRIFLNR